MGDENLIRTLGDYSIPSHKGYRNTIELCVGNNVVPLRSDTIWLMQNDCLFHGLRDFAKPVKAITLPQDVPSTSDRRLIKLKNQVQCLMESHFAPTQPTQVNKITILCEIYSGLHNTYYCMEDPEQAFVEYASSRALSSDTVKNPKLSTSLVLSARSYTSEDPQCSTHIHGSINAITIHPKQPRRPFVEISNMTHDPPEGVVRFPNGTDEFSYKMPHKIEQYNSLLDLEKEHTKSVYLRNDEDKRRGLEYVMSKILGFYKECLEIRPDYVTRIDDEGEVT
uniref:MAK10-like protein n=1 Tax=Tanacetum cinerariifolium TaxID=118510 RepID=A0A699HDV4_TANCI|nr:MAK10-like protein [Tanacetum cinerariifolium]